GKGRVSRDDFEKALADCPQEKLETVAEDMTQSLDEANHLVQELSKRMESIAPGLTSLRQALQECSGLQQQILGRKGPSADVVTAPDGKGDSGVPAGARAVGSRAEAYRQLAQAAAVLQQLEPHSPIPYLVQRAVQLGSLPFPQLIRELVRD